MNPYEILNITPTATDQEIKIAYRKLIKQYHPDRNSSEEAKSRVVLINAAYEILSDPERRARYDSPIYTHSAQPHTEDPVESYKRTFKRKRWEEERKRKEETEARAAYWQPRIYNVMRFISFPILAFAFVLVLDNLLPAAVYQEVAEFGYQVRSGRGRRTQGALVSHIKTAHFDVRVPHELHLNYPYFEDNKPALKISITPIFKIPRIIECVLNERVR